MLGEAEFWATAAVILLLELSYLLRLSAKGRRGPRPSSLVRDAQRLGLRARL
ncbi:MAG: hypothetical protein R3B13_07865 [Polyangiaceae bacterium]